MLDEGNDPNLPSISESRQEKLYYESQNEKIKFFTSTEELVPIQRIRKQLFEAGRTTRDRIMGAIDDIATECAGKEAHQIRRHMKDVYTKILTDFSKTEIG